MKNKSFAKKLLLTLAGFFVNWPFRWYTMAELVQSPLIDRIWFERSKADCNQFHARFSKLEKRENQPLKK